MTILYGTSNPAKLSAMKQWLSGLDIKLLGLKDLDLAIPDVPEDGHTPLENAYQKAFAYYHAFQRPVFSCDSGLYFENIPDEDQPGVHVRNVHGKYLTDQEMINYYAGLARKYGDLTAKYRNAICLIIDEQHIYQAMDPSLESKKFILTSKPHPIIKQGFPLDSLSIEIDSGKYYYDLETPSLDAIERNGFYEFFKRVLNKEQDLG